MLADHSNQSNNLFNVSDVLCGWRSASDCLMNKGATSSSYMNDKRFKRNSTLHSELHCMAVVSKWWTWRSKIFVLITSPRSLHLFRLKFQHWFWKVYLYDWIILTLKRVYRVCHSWFLYCWNTNLFIKRPSFQDKFSPSLILQMCTFWLLLQIF